MKKRSELECLRCGWKWIPKVEFPGQCPSCKSSKYDSLPFSYINDTTGERDSTASPRQETRPIKREDRNL